MSGAGRVVLVDGCCWMGAGCDSDVPAGADGADADERAGEDAERVERGHYRVHVSPAPCGADRAHEQGECGQDDEAQPFEDVVDAAGDEPVGHDVGGCRCIGWIVGHVCSDRKNNGDAVTRIIGWRHRFGLAAGHRVAHVVDVDVAAGDRTLGDAVAVGRGELPHGVAPLEDLGDPGGRCGGGSRAAAVGDDIAHVVAVDVTAWRVPCGQGPCVVGYGESPDGLAPLHDVADATRVGVGRWSVRLCGRGRCGRGRGAAGGVGVQVPLPCVATEDVEVDGTPRVDDTGAAVLAHGLAVCADHPRVGLIAGRAHVGILGDPQTVPVADVLRDGAGDRAGVQQWAHTTRQPFAFRHEAAYPVPVPHAGLSSISQSSATMP